MAPVWTQVVQALASAVSVLVAIVVFVLLRRQIGQLERGIRGETHSGLYQHNFEVMKFIAENSRVRPYFYDGSEIKLGDPDHALVMTTAGIIAALFEHVALQQPNLPVHVWDSWVRHIEETYAKSSAIQQYYKEHRRWYSREVLVLLKDPSLLETPAAT